MIEKIMASIGAIVVKEGFVIGLLVGLMQIMKSIRDGKFNWKLAITTGVGAVVVGSAAWDIGVSAGLNSTVNFIQTMVMSANSFLLTAMISDKTFFENFLKNLTGNRGNLQTNTKKDESN